MPKETKLSTDPAWIKTLAEAKQDSSGWQIHNPEDVKRRAMQDLAHTVDELYNLMSDALEVLNHHRHHVKPMRLMMWQPEVPGAGRGFIVFSGPTQLKLEHRSDFHLEESVITVHAYERIKVCGHVYAPVMDAFGGITWLFDKKLTMTHELIIKQLLKDICTFTMRNDHLDRE